MFLSFWHLCLTSLSQLLCQLYRSTIISATCLQSFLCRYCTIVHVIETLCVSSIRYTKRLTYIKFEIQVWCGNKRLAKISCLAVKLSPRMRFFPSSSWCVAAARTATAVTPITTTTKKRLPQLAAKPASSVVLWTCPCLWPPQWCRACPHHPTHPPPGPPRPRKWVSWSSCFMSVLPFHYVVGLVIALLHFLLSCAASSGTSSHVWSLEQLGVNEELTQDRKVFVVIIQ